MRLCSKIDCPEREGKGYKCAVPVSKCRGEYTETMFRSSGVSEKDIQEMRECRVI
jgi:hypothetical protein